MQTDETQTDHVLSEEHEEEYQQQIYDKIIKSLPGAIRTLILHAKETSFVKFVSLLEEEKLPMTNIALLFLDVVEWFSKGNTHNMRYSPEVKQFWRIGYKLFKGKFLRFMGGLKNQGQCGKGYERPSDSLINFAVLMLSDWKIPLLRLNSGRCNQEYLRKWSNSYHNKKVCKKKHSNYVLMAKR